MTLREEPTRPQESKNRGRRKQDGTEEQSVEYRKVIKDLKARFTENEDDHEKTKRPLTYEESLSQQYETHCSAEKAKAKKLEDEPKDYRTLSAKLAADIKKSSNPPPGERCSASWKKKSNASWTGCEVSGQNSGHHRTADTGVHASTQTEDDGGAKEREKLGGKLEEVVRLANKEMKDIEVDRSAAKQRADAFQSGLKAKVGEGMELLGKLEKLDGGK